MLFRSRKIVRWFGAAFITLGALAALGLAWRLSPWVAGALVLGLMVFLVAGTMLRKGPVAAIMDMLIAYFATLQGVVKAMRGRTVTTWAPAKSR